MAGTSSAIPSVHEADEPYFSTLLEDEVILGLSDLEIAEKLQLQEALLFSSSYHSIPSTEIPDDNVGSDHNGRHESEKDTGESSNEICLICWETTQEMFRNKSCGHLFCSGCISKHVAERIQAKKRVDCPEDKCEGIIKPEDLDKIIVPKQVLDRWGDALCEDLILDKVYCPFNDCSGTFDADGGEGRIVTAVECTYCWRMFCAQCKVAWHAGIECKEFQVMNENHIQLMELRDINKWRHCPKCNFLIEKNQGCLHITCKCKHEFCYRCGADYSRDHSCGLDNLSNTS